MGRRGFTLAEVAASLAVLAVAVAVGLAVLQGRVGPPPVEPLYAMPAAIAALGLALELEEPGWSDEGPAIRVCWEEFDAAGARWRVADAVDHVGSPGFHIYVARMTRSGAAAHAEVVHLPAIAGEAVTDAVRRAAGKEPQLRVPLPLR